MRAKDKDHIYHDSIMKHFFPHLGRANIAMGDVPVPGCDPSLQEATARNKGFSEN